ncbi:hypothetical protein P3T76_010138 [Phytophthora citrophthora]|uniref:DDE-1 domain-containing protein n=1 Tax=Phytophthora citrophthora TaxID=4793 RepID=A0AAD9GE11_9STRA|nr:hypothetical protein P3T76_010138 [Phytophthora citrophthora]
MKEELGLAEKIFRDVLSLQARTRQNVKKTRIELVVSNIYNADQSRICFEYLPKQTVSKKDAKMVWVRGGKDKERFTGQAVNYTCYSCTHEITQHGFISHDFTRSSNLWYNSAWWNSGLSVAFLDFHFAGRDEDEHVLFLWDDFSAHWTDEVEAHGQKLNVYLLKVPSELTSVCQPADISWLRPLK